MSIRMSLASLSVTLLISASAYGQSADTATVKLPQDIEFKGPLTGAPQTAILSAEEPAIPAPAGDSPRVVSVAFSS